MVDADAVSGDGPEDGDAGVGEDVPGASIPVRVAEEAVASSVGNRCNGCNEALAWAVVL